jgi:hypothetical protein
MALQSLTFIGSPKVEELALELCNRPDPDQEWSRAMVLFCPRKVGSRHLEPLLNDAKRDTREHLSSYAKRIEQGEVDD